jgi:hypothetical protein
MISLVWAAELNGEDLIGDTVSKFTVQGERYAELERMTYL